MERKRKSKLLFLRRGRPPQLLKMMIKLIFSFVWHRISGKKFELFRRRLFYGCISHLYNTQSYASICTLVFLFLLYFMFYFLFDFFCVLGFDIDGFYTIHSVLSDSQRVSFLAFFTLMILFLTVKRFTVWANSFQILYCRCFFWSATWWLVLDHSLFFHSHYCFMC